MDRRRGDRLTVSTESWFTEDSMRSSGNEEIHGVMDGAGDHDDHTIHDAHSASEQHHHSPFLSAGVRYRASHVGRHRLTTTTPVVSPRASPPAIVSRVSGRPFSTTVHMSDIFARQVYLVKLCRAIIMYGALTHRLEEYMSTSSLPLEIEGQFSYIPDCMSIGFAHGVELVCASEGINLGKLQDAHDINVDVAHDRLGVKEAARRLDELSDARPKHKVWFLILMYGLASACVAPFGFEGRLVDLPIAFILGCNVGLLQLVFAAKSGLHANVFEFLAAVMMSFMARGFGSINHGQLFCFSALAQSSIVMCLPGYVALCGSLETQGHKIVAASSRMPRMAYYTLSLGCGIPIGAALYGMMDSNAASETHCSNPLSREWCFLFVPGFTICLCAILHAKWRQIPAMLVIAVAGFSVVSYSTEYLTNHFSPNALIPTMLGALTVAILASLYSRWSGRVQSLGLDFVNFWRRRVSRTRRSQADAWPLGPLPSSDLEANAGPPPDFDDGRTPRRVGHRLAAAAMLPGLLVLMPGGLVAAGSLLAGFDAASGAVNGAIFHTGLSLFQVAGVLSIGVSLGALILDPLGRRRGGLTSF
ncbi:hypothetical protein E4U32_007360 [Claviceps aff. humidiphila group G2b]|nr:hypothetical protein E4U32_007360 [Claviceps aff. humidiphila group G2b]